MKYSKIILIIFVFIIFGCKSIVSNSNKNNEQIIKFLHGYSTSFESGNNLIRLDELNEKIYFIFDTLSKTNYLEWNMDNDDLLGTIRNPSQNERNKLKTLNLQGNCNLSSTNNKPQMFYSNGDIVIPFNADEETTIYTRWKKRNNEIEFKNTIIPEIETKNACLFIEEIYYYNKHEYVISKIFGGEGGSQFQSLLVSELASKNNQILIDEITIGYSHDSGDWANLDYEIVKDKILFLELRDSMKLNNSNWEVISKSKKLLKTVVLKQ